MSRACLVVIALCGVICGVCSHCWAGDRKLLIAVLDQITWHDLLEDQMKAPTLHGLATQGGVAMMCARTARGPSGGYLTIGAGSRASSCSIPDTWMSAEGYAFQAQEMRDGIPAGRLYTVYTGWPVGNNAIVHLGIGELLRENFSASYPLRLGLLGGRLRRSGLRVACIGNADTPKSPHRELAAIGMDEQGLVQMGDVGPGLARLDSSVPYRYTTDPQRLVSAFRRAAGMADVVVLELGETSRAAEYAGLMTSAAARATRRGAIERADRLLGDVLASVASEEWAVLLISPTVREPDPQEQFAPLSPVIFFAPGQPPGLLTSRSTRRPGLVVNTDVAPTVLSYFDLELPSEAIGRPMTCQPVPGPDQALARLKADLLRHDVADSGHRQTFRWLPLLATIALGITALLFLLGERAPHSARMLLRALLLLLLAVPPAMLLVAIYSLSAPQMLAGIAGASLVIALVGSWVTGGRSGHVVPALTLAALLSYDLLRGQHMLQWSPFSYSPAAGARFYGIGNEYGGALLGAALLSASGLLSPRQHSAWGERPLAALLLAGIVALVGSPRFGANLGMALGCAAGFTVFVLYLWHERPTAEDLMVGALLALAIVGAAIAADIILRGPEASHIGRWYSSLRSQGWEAAAQVIQRKWAMNWLLTRTSRWTGVAIMALVTYLLALLVRPRALGAGWQARPWLAPAVGACLVGAALSWLVNDSGIVAAAMALLYGAGALGYVWLGEQASPP